MNKTHKQPSVAFGSLMVRIIGGSLLALVVLATLLFAYEGWPLHSKVQLPGGSACENTTESDKHTVMQKKILEVMCNTPLVHIN